MKNISYCGMDCDKCTICDATKRMDLETIRAIAGNDNAEDNLCLGCKTNHNCEYCKHCYIYICCKDKNIENCSECEDFPCLYLKKNLKEESIERIKLLKND